MGSRGGGSSETTADSFSFLNAGMSRDSIDHAQWCLLASGIYAGNNALPLLCHSADLR